MSTKQRVAARLSGLAAALWWGSLTTIGFLVVPLLFKHLPTPALAGGMAAQLFSAQAWVSIGCAMLLLMFSRPDADLDGTAANAAIARRSQTLVMFVALGLLMALLAEFAVSPRIVARDNLKLWHAIGSAMYLVQWLCAAVVLWRLGTLRSNTGSN